MAGSARAQMRWLRLSLARLPIMLYVFVVVRERRRR